jgi:hypothetical protein
MRTERRCVPRTRPGGISYFEFDAGSGGIVLDASEKGLAFQAADAIHQWGPSRIFISPHPEERIELKGNVVWTDRTGKTGGLRFIEPGADSCMRIRNWLKQPHESGVVQRGQDFPLPSWAVKELTDIPPSRLKQDAGPMRTAPLAAACRIEAREERPAEVRPAAVLPPLYTPALTWQSQDSPGAGGRFAHRLATAFLIVAFAVGCVAVGVNFGFVNKLRPKVADSLIRLGEKLNGNANTASRNSSPRPASGQIPAEPPSAVEAIPNTPGLETAGNPGQPHLSVQNSSHRANLVIPREKGSAEHYSRASRFTRERSAEASRLWSEVGAGNSAAEVDLALLYLKGDGVPRNCEQARILLRAGAKGGSREARQQLQKLRTYSCR